MRDFKMEMIMSLWEENQIERIAKKMTRGEKLSNEESTFMKDKMTMNELAGLR
jgi:hypothetical protein